MRRDHFTVDVQVTPEDSGVPTLSIDCDGPEDLLAGRLTTPEGTLDAGEIDVTVRRQAGTDVGVLSLTNRLTGEYILEADVSTEAMSDLVAAADDRADSDANYEVRVTDATGKSLVYEKATLLVYDHDGSLLRQHSLIPGGVEL